MIRVIKAGAGELSAALALRREMLALVNGAAEAEISEELMRQTQEYMERGEQTTALAYADGVPVGCATMSYIRLLPTYTHPTGRRAHLMNVYVREGYRRKGAAREMVQTLIEDARARGASCVSSALSRAASTSVRTRTAIGGFARSSSTLSKSAF